MTYPAIVRLGDVVFWERSYEEFSGVVVGVARRTYPLTLVPNEGRRRRVVDPVIWKSGWLRGVAFRPNTVYVESVDGLAHYYAAFDALRPIHGPIVLRGDKLHSPRGACVIGVLRDDNQIL